MIDISTYRQQIGSFNIKTNLTKTKSNSELYLNSTYRTLYSLSLTIIFIIVLLSLLSCSQYFDISVRPYICEIPLLNITMNIYINWNFLMRMVNGNGRDTITITHWNGGGSYLCLSERGKLEN